jgi:hypothetical protein
LNATHRFLGLVNNLARGKASICFSKEKQTDICNSARLFGQVLLNIFLLVSFLNSQKVKIKVLLSMTFVGWKNAKVR